MADTRHLRLVPSSPEPGVLHAIIDTRTGQVDVVADQLYLAVGTEDEAELAAAETASAITLAAASNVLRDAHIAHRVESDGLLVPLEAWEAARQELVARGWTIHLAD